MQGSLGLQNAQAKKKFLWISHLIFILIVCITLYPSSLALVRSGNILLPTPARDWQGRRVCGHRRDYLQIASSSNLKEYSSFLRPITSRPQLLKICVNSESTWCVSSWATVDFFQLFPFTPWRWLVGRRLFSWYCHGHAHSMGLQEEHFRP